MELNLNKDKIIKTVLNICERNKVICEYRCAENTDSLYFRLSLEGDDTCSHVSFRISDHRKREYVPHFKFLLVRKNTDIHHIERFTENRIKTLRNLTVLSNLEILDKKEGYSNARVSR